MCSIEDTGIGINAEDQSKIFQDFTQSEGGFQRRYGGLGIGLSICHKLVSALAGGMSLTSKTGQGSIFIVGVPVKIASAPTVKQVHPLASAQLPILIVEDNAVNQRVMAKLLEALGYQCIIASNGIEALDILAEQESSLVLMDLQMLEMDGFSCTEAIRQGSAQFKRIPIIAVTANLMDADKEKCLLSGMNDFLEKLVNMAGLKKTLSRYVVAIGNDNA